jgi:hypothetical protein
MVTKDSGPHVKQSGRDAWLRDVSLFCKVLNIAATRAIVVTMDAACYPAFHKFRVAYDGEVEHLRQALRAHGVAWSCGTELVGQPTNDGWHFDATCLDTVVDAVCKWLKKATPFNRSLTDEAKGILLQALSPTEQGGGQRKCWESLLSFTNKAQIPPPLVLYLKGLTQLDRAAHFPRVAAQGVVKRRRKVLVGATHPLPLQCALCLQGLVPLRSGAAVCFEQNTRMLAWMQKGKLDIVDTVAESCSPVDWALTATPTPSLDAYSDSSVLLGGNPDARHAIISRVRTGGTTVRVVVRRGLPHQGYNQGYRRCGKHNSPDLRCTRRYLPD